jgi:hypothetical protein
VDGGRGFRWQLADGTWSFLPDWMASREHCAAMALVSEPVVAVNALLALTDLLGALAGTSPRIGADATPSSAEAPRHAPTTDSTARPRLPRSAWWSDLAPELQERLGDLLAELLQQVARSGDVTEAYDDQ